MIDQGQDQDPMRRRGIEKEGEVTQMTESIVVEAKNDSSSTHHSNFKMIFNQYNTFNQMSEPVVPTFSIYI